MNQIQTQLFGEPPLFTVTQYRSYVNEVVSFAPVMVEGEVSNYRVIPGRQFCYFDIKDKNAVAKCFQAFGKCRLIQMENGNMVKVFGYPTLQKNGSLVIDIRQIRLSGDGALMKAYLMLKDKLEKEGLFDERHKKELPMFPRTIGLIAGKNSSAYHDVTAELTERWKGYRIFFIPSKVQGMLAEAEIVRAITWFNKNLPVDVLIIARGGGSMEDLQAFNTEEVVREIFASKIPVISAIGHEDHWTLSDFVADVRAKTPTKAAQIAVPDKQEILDRLDYLSDRMQSLMGYQINKQKSLLDDYAARLGRLLQFTVTGKVDKLDLLAQKLRMAVTETISKSGLKVAGLEKQLQLLNPLNVLRRGYCVVEKDGKRVWSTVDITTGELLKITLPDGAFDARVENKD